MTPTVIRHSSPARRRCKTRCSRERRGERSAHVLASRPIATCARRPSGAPHRFGPEDQVVQSMPDASPTKWHRAHTTWFFEQFLLVPHLAGYRVFDEQFALSVQLLLRRRRSAPRASATRDADAAGLFARRRLPRACRCRGRAADCDGPEMPSSAEVLRHPRDRSAITSSSTRNCSSPTSCMRSRRIRSRRATTPTGARRVGNTRQRASRRCRPASIPSVSPVTATASTTKARRIRSSSSPVRIARSLVSNAQWLEFIADGGYATPSLWLSDGWAAVAAEGWNAPGYWREIDGVVVFAHARRAPAGRPRRAGHARQLLRGRCLRPLGRQGPADRGRMGGRRARESSRRCLRFRLAMDAKRLSALSGLSRRGRRARRVQRQVHDQPDGAARQLAGDAGRAFARELPQLLLPSARWQFSGLRLADYGA